MPPPADSITIRKPVPADAPAVAEAVCASLDELAPWMPWAVPGYDSTTALQWMNGAFGDTYPFVIVSDDGAVVGSCGLNHVDKANAKANLGYWIRSDNAGKGFATAAAGLVASFAWTETKLNRLEIAVSVENLASQRVAQKLNAHHEGILRHYMKLRDGFADFHMFSLLRSDAEPDNQITR